MTIEELFAHLTDSILQDDRFAEMIDSNMRESLKEAQVQLDDGIKQMKGSQYSRIILNTIYPEESAETTAFFDDLTNTCNEQLAGEYYLIGNSAMTYEMQQSFDGEMLFITLLTAIAIFIVVAIAFHSLIIPAILVLLVQCGVYITVSIIGLQGYSIYFLALLIVECILMGATIDYGKALIDINVFHDLFLSGLPSSAPGGHPSVDAPGGAFRLFIVPQPRY